MDDHLKINKEIRGGHYSGYIEFEYDGLISRDEAESLQAEHYPVEGYGLFDFVINLRKKKTYWKCHDSCD